MIRVGARAVLSVAAVILWAAPVLAQPVEELKALRKEVETLKEGQTAIQRDLQDIKRLLQARPAAPPAGPSPEVVFNLDGVPFKGAKTAKVTVLEFTDYQ